MDVEKLEFKKGFIERYSKITDFEEFKKYSILRARRSLRVNTIKTTVAKLKSEINAEWRLEQVPWCREGFWIEHDERRDIGNLPGHSLGYFYVQDAASMMPVEVLEPKAHEMVLDMCAAPGSKSTQIAAKMENQGILVANDYKGIRLAALGINLQRMGVMNTIVTLMQGFSFRGLQFDKVLLDAPCSGTGTIRKSLKTIQMWNPLMIERLARTQKQLARIAYQNLKPGGIIVYSTCSIDPVENEGVIDFILEEFPEARLEQIKLPAKSSEPITEFDGRKYNPEVGKTLRVWPQDNNTEGFFVAKIRKENA
ncbi:MAG: RsmB/NOP family class I SAM-dependent RNA methyltransferase [Candidatus Woesearchaeota archaeon]